MRRPPVADSLKAMTESVAHPFQVDLRSVVDLLSRHLYSSPQVFLRELLQNARDAIRARAEFDPDAPAGLVSIVPADAGSPFVLTDNGIGLDAAEASELLATVGRTSKRDEMLGLRRDGYLGQFGIGLLSCLMVADSIVVRSRSARGARPIEWVGSASGTFTLRELSDAEGADLPVGTEVSLTPRPDEAALVTGGRVRSLVRHYGRYLPDTQRLRMPQGWETLNDTSGLFDDPDPEVVLDAGEELLGTPPLAAIPLEAPGTRGFAYVLPWTPPPAARQAHTVYLSRMLVSDRTPDLLPDWAFFTRAIVTTDRLTPTASREAFVEDQSLADTRDALGRCIRRWITREAGRHSAAFESLVSIHQVALKSMALTDDDLARTLLPHLEFETSGGPVSLGEHLAEHREIRFAATVDEFRQLAAVVPTATPLFNAGYIHDADLLARVGEMHDVAVTRVRVADLMDDLDPPPLADRVRARELDARASAALAASDCDAATRVFQPADLPALYIVDPAVLRRRDRRAAGEGASSLYAELLAEVEGIVDDGPHARATLCLNWANDLVRRLSGLSDPVVFDRALRLLHVQARLAGHHPLTAADRAVLTTATIDLIQLSVGWEDHDDQS